MGKTVLGAVLAGVAALGGAAGARAQTLDEVTFATNWLAQAEHGGFYQAVADGTYEAYGLDVTIRQGGPQVAGRALLIAGQVEFYMGGGLGALLAVEENVPTVIVASIFQKDPQMLMAHPEAGIESFADLASLDTLYLGAEGYDTYFRWMKVAFEGFSDEQFRPYTYNPAPFIADAGSAQQGYLTSEPFGIEREAGWAPAIFLLADNGYDPFSTTIETRTDLIAENPDLVQRFVDASIIGWYNYLYGDNTAANELIKADNPEMTDEQIAFSIDKLMEFDILESGDAETGGIGCVTEAKAEAFFDVMVEAEVLPADLDWASSIDTSFTCKGVGLDVKAALAAQ